MKKMVSIWNINSFAEYFMQIFTKYEKDYKRACEKFIAEREDFEKKLKKGDNVIFTAFGAGFVHGASYIKWGYDGSKTGK